MTPPTFRGEFSADLNRPSIARRDFLRAGLSTLAGLSLTDLFRLRAVAAPNSAARQSKLERTALIVVWLHGGASHLETFDPKPTAPLEFRGPYSPIHTSVPGMQLCELLPELAKVAHQFTLLRSLVHSAPCHLTAPQTVFTGHQITQRTPKPIYPDLFSVVDYLRRDPKRALPNNVGVPPISYLGAAYLGQTHEPFNVRNDPNRADFDVPNLFLKNQNQIERLNARVGLLHQLDHINREVDQLGSMEAFDAYQDQAWRILTSPEVRKAFDIKAEDARTRDRYGRNTWGQQCLLARRLVEAGVELVSTDLRGPLCGRIPNWDDHAVNFHIFDALKHRAPLMDQAVSALISDLHERGLDKRVMMVVGGDFGRTPRINYAKDSASGAMQPGREHWPNACSFLFSGGNIAEGNIIGATDRRGEAVVERRVGVGDLVATIYRHLGIDAERVSINDFSGRPVPILPSGMPIPELTGRG